MTGTVCFPAAAKVLGYVSITSALPAALTWLLVFSFLSKLLPNKFRVEASKMLSTMGQFFQVSPLVLQYAWTLP